MEYLCKFKQNYNSRNNYTQIINNKGVLVRKSAATY